jgi:hypothetical protein
MLHRLENEFTDWKDIFLFPTSITIFSMETSQKIFSAIGSSSGSENKKALVDLAG